MKRLSYLFGILVIASMLVSLLPTSVMAANPSTIDRDPTLQWATFKVPDRFYGDFVIPSSAPSFDISEIAIGSDGKTFYAVDPTNKQYEDDPNNQPDQEFDGAFNLYKSTNAGVAWSDKIGKYLWRAYNDYWTEGDGGFRIWGIEVAPDDPNFIVATTSDERGGSEHDVPVDIWVSSNGGITWSNTNLLGCAVIDGDTVYELLDAGFSIGAVAISPSYGSGRSIAVGLRNTDDGDPIGYVFTLEAGAVIPGWKDANFQNTLETAIPEGGDVLALKFSPNYSGDFALFVVSTDENVTLTSSHVYLHVAFRNVKTNNTMAWDNKIGPAWTGFPREIAVTAKDSPGADEVVSADLELPSDFNGDDARLRKFFISYDAPYAEGVTGGDVADVYRLDNTTIYRLNVPAQIYAESFSNKRISSIAYYGTTTQGKLLAGAVLGNPCSATVDVWYTLDPLACPAPCWQTSWKPPTGAAGVYCIGTEAATFGYGNAQVAWSPDGKRGYAATGTFVLEDAQDWPSAFEDGLQLDESAFSITRNDGITWSQISLIDTKIDKYTDTAPAMDCTKIYVTSMNFGTENDLFCDEFDSIWMSPNADFKGTQLGTTWERILTKRTAETCEDEDGNHAILRLAPDKTDGSVVFWAAGGAVPMNSTDNDENKQLIMWSEDGGDIWYYIRPTGGSIDMNVQDLSVQSSSVIYVLNREAQVLKMVYARPNWKNADTSIYPSDTCLNVAHSIDSLLTGTNEYVLVGGGTETGSESRKVSYSADGGKTWTQTTSEVPFGGEIHVHFDPGFETNKMLFAGVEQWNGNPESPTADSLGGGLYRWTWGTSTLWDDIFYKTDRGFTGIEMTSDGIFYAPTYKESGVSYAPNGNKYDSGVERILNPKSGTPKPGLKWDRLVVGLPLDTELTTEVSDLKLCGCLPNMNNITLFTIDNNFRHSNPWPEFELAHSAYTASSSTNGAGYIYVFVDCVAKIAPAVTGPETVGCDPVTGRNQEVNISWEQPCLMTGYTITVTKDSDQTLEMLSTPTGENTWYTPPDVTKPAIILPTAGYLTDVLGSITTQTQLECGHKYFYQIRGRMAVTGQTIRTKNSAVKSFTVKSGLPVTTQYIGPVLLNPSNGSAGISRQPVSFSWGPYIDATEYQFQLSKANDATLASPLVDAKTANTAYSHSAALDYSTNYFWRVRETLPAPSDWSPVFSFMTEKAPPPPTTPTPTPPPAPPITPAYVWVIIAIGALLVIVVLILIVRTRRV